MRFYTLFVIGILFLSLITLGAHFVYQSSFSDFALENQAFFHVNSIAETKQGLIQDFLNERKNDANFLASSQDIKNILNSELSERLNSLTQETKSVSKNSLEKMENYLLKNPEMTLKDLQNDEVFQKIAVTPIGEKGYTFVYDVDSQINAFHKETTRVGYNYSTLSDKSKNLREYLLEAKFNQEVSGFYDRVEPDGIVREKYMTIKVLNIKTADGKRLGVGATVYLDEYDEKISLAKELDEEFRSFQKKGGYEDLIFINKEGTIIWSAVQRGDLGKNINSKLNNQEGLSKLYENSKLSQKNEFLGPIYYSPAKKLVLFMSSPILDEKGDFIGLLVLEINKEDIYNLIHSKISFNEYGKIILVNSKGQLLNYYERTNADKNIINSQIKKDCFLNEKKDNFGFYEDEFGKSYFGAYRYLNQSEWCIIVQMDKENFFERIPGDFKYFQRNVFYVLVLSLILAMVLFFLLSENYYLKKITRKMEK